MGVPPAPRADQHDARTRFAPTVAKRAYRGRAAGHAIGAYAGTSDAGVGEMSSKRYPLTWEDAMLMLVSWVFIVWLILADG